MERFIDDDWAIWTNSASQHLEFQMEIEPNEDLHHIFEGECWIITKVYSCKPLVCPVSLTCGAL